MIRCCMCHKAAGNKTPDRGLEPTTLPGSGYRCRDHKACAERVRGIVSAHVGFGEVCGS